MIYLLHKETQILKSDINHLVQSIVCNKNSVLPKYGSINRNYFSIDESILVNNIIQNSQNKI